MPQAADFFVSYTSGDTSGDRALAEWIPWQLEAEGYQLGGAGVASGRFSGRRAVQLRASHLSWGA